MQKIIIISSLCILWFITLTAASVATITVPKSSATNVDKLKDSKISRIQTIQHYSESAAKYQHHNPDYFKQQNAENPFSHMENPLVGGVGLFKKKKIQNKKKLSPLLSSSSSSLTEKKKSLTNHDLLQSLGLTKLSPSHHRKRLAVESRHHTRPDDSKMFVIKLPPNPYYYANNYAQSKNSINDKNEKIPIDFRSNGKPRRIYHWNIPELKKMIGGHSMMGAGRNSNLRSSNDISELIDIKNIPTWTNPWENETIEKSYSKLKSKNDINQKNNVEKMYKKNSPEYYAPIRPKKHTVQNYFANNGKPKTFYIVKKNQKPYYRKLIE